MSEALTAAPRTAMREHSDEPSLLHEIIDRMSMIEARQLRPSPVKLSTWEDIERFAEKAARSGMVPRDYISKPDAICIAIQMGSELGLAPMQALQNIAVVNGRPAVWGDALPALCRASGIARSIREWSSGEGDNLTFYCEAIRKDDPNPVAGKFSIADAKKAGLWSKGGPWTQYPSRMLQMRARGFCLRDAFPDVLKGLITAEEATDIPFEATGLTPRIEPTPIAPVVRPAPAEPKKMTVAEWLDRFEARARAAATADEVDAIMAEDEVQKANDRFINGNRKRFDMIVAEALDRTKPKPPTSDVPWDAAPDSLPDHAIRSGAETQPIENDPTLSVAAE